MRHVEREVPVLIHSTNPNGAEAMGRRLGAAGFDVSKVPMYLLTMAAFRDWIADVKASRDAA